MESLIYSAHFPGQHRTIREIREVRKSHGDKDLQAAPWISGSTARPGLMASLTACRHYRRGNTHPAVSLYPAGCRHLDIHWFGRAVIFILGWSWAGFHGEYHFFRFEDGGLRRHRGSGCVPGPQSRYHAIRLTITGIIFNPGNPEISHSSVLSQSVNAFCCIWRTRSRVMPMWSPISPSVRQCPSRRPNLNSRMVRSRSVSVSSMVSSWSLRTVSPTCSSGDITLSWRGNRISYAGLIITDTGFSETGCRGPPRTILQSFPRSFHIHRPVPALSADARTPGAASGFSAAFWQGSPRYVPADVSSGPALKSHVRCSGVSTR